MKLRLSTARGQSRAWWQWLAATLGNKRAAPMSGWQPAIVALQEELVARVFGLGANNAVAHLATNGMVEQTVLISMVKKTEEHVGKPAGTQCAAGVGRNGVHAATLINLRRVDDGVSRRCNAPRTWESEAEMTKGNQPPSAAASAAEEPTGSDGSFVSSPAARIHLRISVPRRALRPRASSSCPMSRAHAHIDLIPARAATPNSCAEKGSPPHVRAEQSIA